MGNFRRIQAVIVILLILLGLIFLFYLTVQKKTETDVSTSQKSDTASFYTVKKGDSLWAIALRLYGDGFRWVDIAKANNLTHPYLIRVGAILKVPKLAGPKQKAGVITPTQTTSPSQVLNLSNWKLTLPTGPSENPTEIEQPALSTFTSDPWFIVAPEGGALRFRAAVKGATTEGSDYPRSELREMTNGGKAKASWSSTSGVHSMFLDQAITAVPQKKKHLVAGQIHDAIDDVIVIRLDYPKLYINVDGDNKYTLDPSYSLGKRFSLKFEVENGQTKVYYNNGSEPSYTLDLSYSNAYFKAGAYPQSNCNTEKDPSLCNDNNFGEVVIYQLAVTHQ